MNPARLRVLEEPSAPTESPKGGTRDGGTNIKGDRDGLREFGFDCGGGGGCAAAIGGEFGYPCGGDRIVGTGVDGSGDCGTAGGDRNREGGQDRTNHEVA